MLCAYPPAGLTTSEDDEYRWAMVEDPKVMVTTSRDPSSKLKQFAKVAVAWGFCLCFFSAPLFVFLSVSAMACFVFRLLLFFILKYICTDTGLVQVRNDSSDPNSSCVRACVHACVFVLKPHGEYMCADACV